MILMTRIEIISDWKTAGVLGDRRIMSYL